MDVDADTEAESNICCECSSEQKLISSSGQNQIFFFKLHIPLNYGVVMLRNYLLLVASLSPARATLPSRRSTSAITDILCLQVEKESFLSQNSSKVLM
ncbi:hypothetical protein Anas_14590 [Armadillidium nasatum]|uniref:Uncharacterized protein n=1 Tax=Armadillidium nasatum TaxID=96803 RepID=A0A5N5T3J8_9CRUS|nr:hypothetical protein Anas_14590 [Armadillidium nasatum]